ncbi:hypothetical protein N7G274_007364 [Stereocaulon virgatum]|uniref:Spindle pole body component n=1 Tax=Stereocaulon virgatum TaxID=373712 RepID=A0ABR4A4T1_9LECA
MIHELLLGISGHPSPLLSSSGQAADTNDPLQFILSPAEKALLHTLTQDLGGKNNNIRTNASALSSSHPSTVCRAVSTAIVSRHLASFQSRVLEVEKDILEQDASIVGAYNIVPLSAIVGAFDGWGRKLEWLWRLVQFMRAPNSNGHSRPGQSENGPSTAAELMEHLRHSTHTGYPDIEQIALDLVKVAETAWLKQISTWVLYGRHPVTGTADFFIVQGSVNRNGLSKFDEYSIQYGLVPHFVTKATAQSILFIGKALNHIRERQNALSYESSRTSAQDLALLPTHLAHLSSLEIPLSPTGFSAAIGAIRLSLSQNALQKLLPMTKVMEILRLLKDFFLLDNGEFAIALITAADERLISRNRPEAAKQNLVNDLASMTIKEGEVSAVLARTWTALASLQILDPAYDEVVDDQLDQASELIRLSLKSLSVSSTPSQAPLDKQSMILFDDLLLPSSTVLSLRVPSPLDLFLTSPDVDAYSRIHAYLLAIRRAHLRLSKLFLLSVLRRDHPSPNAPILLNQKITSGALAHRRARADQRTKSMRPIWATIGYAAFFLAEIGEYFQGEVVKSSWSTFQSWLLPSLASDMPPINATMTSSVGSGGRSHPSRPNSSRSSQGTTLHSPHDPETLTQAHKSYLAALTNKLLLSNSRFTSLLRRFMTSIDHLSALMQRLNNVQQHSDFETDTGVTNAASNSAAEEQRLMEDLRLSRQKVASGIQDMIDALRAIDATRTGARTYHGNNATTESYGYVPWAGGGVDRLLLKFDYGAAERTSYAE